MSAPGDACLEPAATGLAEARRLLGSMALPPPRPTEDLPLVAAAGRVLGAALTSRCALPRFDNAAVDGFAFRGADLARTGPRLRLIAGRSAGGHPFQKSVPAGCALAILTGAAMPDGTDTVAMIEDCRIDGDTVTVPSTLGPGANRRRAGEDVVAGAPLLPAGSLLRAPELGLVAAQGIDRLTVLALPRVALFSCGDDLGEPGAVLPHGGIYDANRAMLRALLATLPVLTDDRGILPDDEAAVTAALCEAAAGHELVLTSGGASRSAADHVAAAAERQGSLVFRRLRTKPGRPVALGRLGQSVLVGLPGNPVAALVSFLLIARPLLRRLAGLPAMLDLPALPVPAAFAASKRPGRSEVLRARLEQAPDGALRARRISPEGSHLLLALTRADGLIELGEAVEEVRPGDLVPFTSFAALGLGS